MPISGHVTELRRRGRRAALAWVVALVLGYLLAAPVLEILREPIDAVAANQPASLNYDSITGAFDLRIRLTLYLSVLLSSPVWLHETLAFAAPGLTRTERRYLFGTLAGVIPLFVAGCALGVAIVPGVVELLAGFAAPEETTILTASYYLTFVLKFVVATGVAFTLPVFIVVLNVAGLLPAATITAHWKPVVLAIVVFAALTTPSADLLSMFLVAGAMCALFGVALVIAVLHDARARRTRRRCMAAHPAALPAAGGHSPTTRPSTGRPSAAHPENGLALATEER